MKLHICETHMTFKNLRTRFFHDDVAGHGRGSPGRWRDGRAARFPHRTELTVNLHLFVARQVPYVISLVVSEPSLAENRVRVVTHFSVGGFPHDSNIGQNTTLFLVMTWHLHEGLKPDQP